MAITTVSAPKPAKDGQCRPMHASHLDHDRALGLVPRRALKAHLEAGSASTAWTARCRRRVCHRYQTIRGHVFCSFLALVLKKALEDRIAALGHAGSWPEIIADLDALTETEIEHDGKRFLLRSAPRPAASLALRAAGVALPPTVRKAAID
jgi:hypothetical protein